VNKTVLNAAWRQEEKVLVQLMYKNKSQHRQSRQFRGLDEVRIQLERTARVNPNCVDVQVLRHIRAEETYCDHAMRRSVAKHVLLSGLSKP